MRELIVNSAVTHSLLLILPILLALLLRRARCPGAAVVGGVLAGVLLGPSVLGRAAPDEFERHFIGGVAEREELDAVRRRQGADLMAAAAAGTSAEWRAELDARHRAELEPLEAALVEARWGFQRPFRSYTAATAVLVLLTSGVLRIRATAAPHAISTTTSVGLGSALVPGVVAFATGRSWFDLETPEALLLAGAVSIGPWAVRRGDRMSADAAELGGAHMLQTAGRVALVVAALAAVAGFALKLSWPRALWIAPLAAAPIGWMLPALRDDDPEKPRPGAARTVLEMLVLPGIAACAVLRTEVFVDTRASLWLLLLVVVLSGDGRWFGAFLGAMAAAERRSARTMRLVLGAMAAGPTQLVVAALGVHAGLLSGGTAWALVIGATLVEVTAPARRNVARTIEEAEDSVA